MSITTSQPAEPGPEPRSAEGSGDFDYAGFARRANAALFPEKLTAFSRRVGMASGTLSPILRARGLAAPRLDVVARLADGLGVSLDWLVFGRGHGPSEVGAIRLTHPVPRLEHEAVSPPGAGQDGELQAVNRRRSHLHRAAGAGLTVIEVRGDAMAPTICDRDHVLVDRNAPQLCDAVFAFVRGGEAQVKRVRPLTDGLMLLSDNPAHAPETLKPEDAVNLEVIGRVLGVVHAL